MNEMRQMGISQTEIRRTQIRQTEISQTEIRQTAGGRQTVLYPARDENRPLIVVNHYSQETDKVADALRTIGDPDINLLFVYGLEWEHDMAPWSCRPLRPSDKPFSGGADEYLKLLLTKILPPALEAVRGEPVYKGIAGYSLAGLFAIYSMYNCDDFDRVASISGSMWFPGFLEYVLDNRMKVTPDRIYMSLGDKEKKTGNPQLSKVQINSEAMVKHFKDAGISVTWELNPGNHFTDSSRRCAAGINALVR